MPGERPYIQNIIQRETARIAGGELPTPPVPEGRPATDPNADPFPGTIDRASVALRGLPRILTREGRSERAQERLARLNHEAATTATVVQKVELNPQSGRRKPKDKIGWPGTHKTDNIPVTWLEMSRDNIGMEMLDIKSEKLPPTTATPNTLRPASGSEVRQTKRFNRHWDRRRQSGNEADWMVHTYGELLDDPQVPLTRGERKALRGARATRDKGYKKEDKATERITDIVMGQDSRGKTVNRRRANARRKII